MQTRTLRQAGCRVTLHSKTPGMVTYRRGSAVQVTSGVSPIRKTAA